MNGNPCFPRPQGCASDTVTSAASKDDLMLEQYVAVVQPCLACMLPHITERS